MGLERICLCRVANETAEAKALLESGELILRAPFKRSFSLAALGKVRVEGEALVARADGTEITLVLGAATAARWAKKMLTPPPSLAAKLGIDHANPAQVIGTVDDSALAEALEGHIASAVAARLSIAIVADAAELDAALAKHAALPNGSPIWVIHGKGPKAAFGETPVRAHMRALGYRDTKVSAVSQRLSATRYSL